MGSTELMNGTEFIITEKFPHPGYDEDAIDFDVRNRMHFIGRVEKSNISNKPTIFYYLCVL